MNSSSVKNMSLIQLRKIVGDKPMASNDAHYLSLAGTGTKCLLFPSHKKNEFILHQIDSQNETEDPLHFKGKVSVKKNGKIRFVQEDSKSKETFKSVDDFIKQYRPISPPSEKEYKRAILLNQIAHVWGLTGSIDLGHGICYLKTGSFIEHCMQTLTDQIDDLGFPENNADNIFNRPSMKRAMKIAFSHCLELEDLKQSARQSKGKWKKVRDRVIQMIETGYPILLSGGFEEHGIYIVYYNGYLAITNRGARHPNNPSGTFYFSVDPELLKKKLGQKDFLFSFLGEIDEETFLTFCPYFDGEEIKGTMAEELKLTYIAFDPKSDQKIGNCSMANLISAMHSFAVLRRGFSVGKIEKFKIDYKAFSFAVRTQVLEKAAHLFTPKNNQLKSDYLSAWYKMREKIKSYEDRGKYSEGKGRIAIQNICHYYFDKMAADNEEMAGYVKLIDHLACKHYPCVTKDEAYNLLSKRRGSAWILIRDTEDNTYCVLCKGNTGPVFELSIPSKSILTIDQFTEDFPLELRVPIKDLKPESRQKVELFEEFQKGSIGRITSTEEQLLLEGQNIGAWFIKESPDQNGYFALTFIDTDFEIKTWMISPESLSTPLTVYRNFFKERNQLRPLYALKTLKKIRSGKLEKQPKKFKRPHFIYGKINLFTVPQNRKMSVDEIVGRLNVNLNSALTSLYSIELFISHGLTQDDYSIAEASMIRQLFLRGKTSLTREQKQVSVWLKSAIERKLSKINIQYWMEVLKSLGIDHTLISKLLMGEDIPVGTWFALPSLSDEKKYDILYKTEDEAGNPIIAYDSYPIDFRTNKFLFKCQKGEVKIGRTQLGSELSMKVIPKELRAKLLRKQKYSNVFFELQKNVSVELDREGARRLLEKQGGKHPFWLVRSSGSTPGALVISTLSSDKSFNEFKFTHKKFIESMFGDIRKIEDLNVKFGVFLSYFH